MWFKTIVSAILSTTFLASPLLAQEIVTEVESSSENLIVAQHRSRGDRKTNRSNLTQGNRTNRRSRQDFINRNSTLDRHRNRVNDIRRSQRQLRNRVIELHHQNHYDHIESNRRRNARYQRHHHNHNSRRHHSNYHRNRVDYYPSSRRHNRNRVIEFHHNNHYDHIESKRNRRYRYYRNYPHHGVNLSRRRIIVNPVVRPIWSWNNGHRWYSRRDYWGGGFWGGFILGAITGNLVNGQNTYSNNNYYVVEKNTPGHKLLFDYGLTQTYCDRSNNIVIINGPQNSQVCALPNKTVPPGFYDIDLSTLTLVAL